jgi:hypothetical protein
VLLPKDGHAGLLTVLDYLTLSNEDLFVTNISTGTVYKIPLHGEALPAAGDVSMFQLEEPITRIVNLKESFISLSVEDERQSSRRGRTK